MIRNVVLVKLTAEHDARVQFYLPDG